MEKLSYEIELVDNGAIIRDNDDHHLEVFEQQDNETYVGCYKRAIAETIGHYIATLLDGGSDKLEVKCKYSIKIQVK